MNYAIQGTSVTVTDELNTYLQKRLSALDKLTSADSRVDVELQFLKEEAKKYRAEYMLHDTARGAVLRAEVQGSTLHEAIDVALAELVRELKQGKEKRQDVWRRSAARAKEYIRGWREKF